MTKNTFFSIISIRFPMDTYPGLFLCSSLSVSEIIGIAPVKPRGSAVESGRRNHLRFHLDREVMLVFREFTRRVV